jgi:hypothetical protein
MICPKCHAIDHRDRFELTRKDSTGRAWLCNMCDARVCPECGREYEPPKWKIPWDYPGEIKIPGGARRLSRKPVSIEQAIIEELVANARVWGLVSLQTESRMDRRGCDAPQAEVVNSALLLFIKAKKKH